MDAPKSTTPTSGGWRLPTAMGGRIGPGGVSTLRPGRPWPALSWSLGLTLFLIPLGLLTATIFSEARRGAAPIVLTVKDRVSGAPLGGAIVSDGDQQVLTDASGAVTLPASEAPRTVLIRQDRYAPISVEIPAAGPVSLLAVLRPSTVEGTILDARTRAPVSGVIVSVVTDDGVPGPATTTTADGRYLLADIPDRGRLRVESPDYQVVVDAVGDRSRIDVDLVSAVVTGVVRDESGAPVVGARVGTPDGAATTVTLDDGTYRLTGVATATELLIRAAGFADLRIAIAPDRRVEATIQPQQIKAVYANLGTLSDRTRYQALLDIADQTEINAIVIDVKQDTIYYDTAVQFFRDVPGMVTPIYDPRALLAELDAHGIYSIARMVVFKDPVVAEGRPDLAVQDEVTGKLWRDDNGAAWVNAFHQELWQANADLAVELAELGFDEIQYDYIRFPSDGDLRTADFGNDYSEAARRAAITGAVRLASERIRPTGAKFALDLFPIVAIFGDDQGIGQTVQDLTPYADYICLMIYPSHYETGNIPVDGHPNDFPGETVDYTLMMTEKLIPGTRAKMRPWLQDFTYPLQGFAEYGPAEVRAQIDAAEAHDVSGWMLWNAAGKFQVAALAPES